MEENHNTILKQAVRAVLKPEGLFQNGSSRIWVDDNGWFLTVVEFQGSMLLTQRKSSAVNEQNDNRFVVYYNTANNKY